MTMQPSPPSIPDAPGLSVQERTELANGLRQANAVSRDVQQVVEQTTREAAQTGAGSGGRSSVIKDNAGRIVVTGPNGKTVVIDPRTGLDGDQIQEVVQTALQPPQLPRNDGPNIPREVLPIVAMALTFLLLVVWMISRAISGRRVSGGPTMATLAPDATARLARIEQAVEAVAIEVERISEAQRYSAQLLTDRFTPPNTAAIARTVDGSAGRG